MLEDENLTPVSALPSRDPNGEGLPLWPAYGQTEEYVQLNLDLSAGQRQKELELEFWTGTLPLVRSSSRALLAPLSSLVFRVIQIQGPLPSLLLSTQKQLLEPVNVEVEVSYRSLPLSFKSGLF